MEGDGHRGLPAEGFPEATQGGLEVCLDHKAAHRDGLQTGTGIRMHVCAHKKVRVHETGGWVGEALGVEFSNTQAMRSPTPELTHRHIHTSSHIRAQTHPHVLTHVHTGNRAAGPPSGLDTGPDVTSTTSPLSVNTNVPEAGSQPHPTTSPGPNRGALLLVGGSLASR